MDYERVKAGLESALDELSGAEEQPTYERRLALIVTTSRIVEDVAGRLEREYNRLHQEMYPPVDSGKL